MTVNPSDSSDGNNAEFLINLKKAFGKYGDIVGDCFVNNTNFAFNTRGYNFKNLESWDNGNIDTAMGITLYHENRFMGKAAYGLDLESLNQ